jgi:predicted DNA-binding transcriptional regulator
MVVYVWLVFFPPIAGADLLLLKLTGSVAVAGVFGILAWIGYTLATTPPAETNRGDREGDESVRGENGRK